jgi:hypothetical protein
MSRKLHSSNINSNISSSSRISIIISSSSGGGSGGGRSKNIASLMFLPLTPFVLAFESLAFCKKQRQLSCPEVTITHSHMKVDLEKRPHHVEN